MGVVGLLIWDGVFPDRRDVRILGVLPVPIHRFVAARLAALGRVFVLFAHAALPLQSVVFGLTVSGYGAPISPHSRHRGALRCRRAGVRVRVLRAVAAQCLLLLVFGRRAAQAASVTFQVLFAVGLVQLLFFLPELVRALRAGGATHEGAAALAAFPPTWFFAIYEQLAGPPGTADERRSPACDTGDDRPQRCWRRRSTAPVTSYLSQRALEGRRHACGRHSRGRIARRARLGGCQPAAHRRGACVHASARFSGAGPTA